MLLTSCLGVKPGALCLGSPLSTAALVPPATRRIRWCRSTSGQPATRGVQEPLRPCYHWLIGGLQCCWNWWWRGGQLLLVVATACTFPFTCCSLHVSAPESMKCLPRDRGAARPWWPMILLWPPCLLEPWQTDTSNPYLSRGFPWDSGPELRYP